MPVIRHGPVRTRIDLWSGQESTSSRLGESHANRPLLASGHASCRCFSSRGDDIGVSTDGAMIADIARKLPENAEWQMELLDEGQKAGIPDSPGLGDAGRDAEEATRDLNFQEAVYSVLTTSALARSSSNKRCPVGVSARRRLTLVPFGAPCPALPPAPSPAAIPAPT